MTLPKAIKQLKRLIPISPTIPERDDILAIKLGIEALKEVVDARSHGGRLSVGPLEGETEE